MHSGNQLTAIEQATFAPIARTLVYLFLAENNIKQVDAVLKGMLQPSKLVEYNGGNQRFKPKVLTMDGNPSTCSLAASTYQNPGVLYTTYVYGKPSNSVGGSVVCVCAPGFAYASYTGYNTTNIASAGYLCQKLSTAVVIPPTVVSLRSKRFVLRGPKAQLARSTPQQFFDATFRWNGYLQDVAITLAWDPEDNATAVVQWQKKSGIHETYTLMTLRMLSQEFKSGWPPSK